MTTALRPDGHPVAVERVSIVSPGLRGKVDVLPGGVPGTRGAGPANAKLTGAFRASGMREQRTIVIHDHSVDPAALRGGVSRATRHGEPGLSITVPGPGSGMGQVLLAADEAGALSWVFPDKVPTAGGVTRGGDTRTYTVPVAVSPVPQARGGGQRGLIAAIGKKILKVLAFELLKKSATELAGSFAARWEQQHHAYRLRPFEPGGYRDPDARALTTADLALYQGRPALLLIHGEMNLSHSGFSRLPPGVLRRLYDRYQGRVLAFDHPTISATPVANGTWLAGILPPAGLTVDILAHSRGGLLARLLAEQPGAVGLEPGRLHVRRLVMAGTPNRGTPLADPGKLDHYLDLVTTVLDFVPDIPVIEVLNIVISVVKQLAVGAYDGLDGLTGMKPGSPLLADLNKRRPTAATYHAISSDYRPPASAPLAGAAVDRVASLIFKQSGNDLIVPEAGVHEENGASAFPVAGPLILTAAQSVDHFSYWASPAVHDKIDLWLTP